MAVLILHHTDLQIKRALDSGLGHGEVITVYLPVS
jgi:hypothetical protein